MKFLVCLSLFAISTAYATYVSYPYVYRTPLVQNGFYPSGYGFSTLGAPSLTVVKPFYPGFYDYRLSLSPSFYQPGLYSGGGILTSPTIIHLIPAESEDKKKEKKGKKGKPKDGKDEETTTMASDDDKLEDIEKAEMIDESENSEKEKLEVESV